MGVGRGANKSSTYKRTKLRTIRKGLGPGLILWHNPSNGKEERGLRVFENRALRRIFGSKRDVVTGE